MAVVGEPELSAVPGTVFTPRQVRILKLAVIVMGVLLVGGFAFVLAAIFYQASRPAQGQAAAGALAGRAGQQSIELAVPGEAKVTGIALDGDRLAVQLAGSAGPEIAVIDLGSGKILARVRLKSQ
jgi:hypothetical protein